jgi:Tfp pilus assembly protein PilF
VVRGFDLTGASDAGLLRSAAAAGQQELALAVIFQLKGYPHLARALLEDAVEANGDSVVALLARSIAEAETGDDAAANRTVEALLAMEPRLFSALYRAAEHAVQQARFADARQLYRRAADEKDDAGVLLKLALLEDAAGNLQGAEHAMERYISAFPDHYVGYSQLAWFYAKRGEQLQKALDLAERADRMQPGNVSILDTLGWVHFSRGNLAEADRYLHAANAAAHGRSPDVLYHLAALAHRKGDSEKAKSLLQDALALSDGFETRAAALKLQQTIGGS